MFSSPVVESMDIVFLLVSISSMNLFLPIIERIKLSFINPLIKKNYDIRLALIKFIPGDEFSAPIVHAFTTSVASFESWFANDHAPIEQHTQAGAIAICNALREALKLDWRTTNIHQCHENIVFLVTDGFPCRHLIDPIGIENNDSPCACDDLQTISDTFVNRDLTLMIVGVGEIVSICDNLYGAIAKNTGGEYIPLENADHILSLTCESVITQGYTLSQSLRHIKQEDFEKNSSYHYSMINKQDQSEIKHCQMMAQKGAWLLNPFHRVNYC